MADANATNPGPVTMTRQPTTIPTYVPKPAGRNPVFYEKRAYQGASGKCYPIPVVDQPGHEKTDVAYDSVALENEWIRVLALPGIGGRIHVGFDKTCGYDFVYHNHVIKPGIIGTAGPWCSGGIEFNWPQHHRPTTFLPVETALEERPDGGRTAWFGEVEPLYGLKAMHGVTLLPGRSLLVVEARVSNPTRLPQPFMWWVNLGVHCNEDYRVNFPPDVRHLAFHDRARISDWPMVQDPTTDPPDQPFDGSWFRNHRQAGSFMVMDGTSGYDFLQGYDQGKRAGTIHVADRHASPGKKLFTWGNSDFSRAWRNNLTDEDGDYLELMTGVYCDNQPDFSWLQPHETRTFRQVWYPMRGIGLVQNATEDAAVRLDVGPDRISFGVHATGRFEGAALVLTAGDRTLYERRLDLDPAHPFQDSVARPAGLAATDLRIVLRDAGGRELVSYRPMPESHDEAPAPRSASPEPAALATTEELYLHGLHLEQYRHHSLDAADYYREALRRDPGDVRCNHALGLLALRDGRPGDAEPFLRKALERLVSRNTNPPDGTVHYDLGLCLLGQDRFEEAYGFFAKAAWSRDRRPAAMLALAELDARKGDLAAALEHVRTSLAGDPENGQARVLEAAVLRRSGRATEAVGGLRAWLSADPLDEAARFGLSLALRAAGNAAGAAKVRDELRAMALDKAETYLGIARELARSGQTDDALAALDLLLAGRPVETTSPLAWYWAGALHDARGEAAAALEAFCAGERARHDDCFPNRTEDEAVLRCARRANPDGAMAPYHLGNLLYDRQRVDEEIEAWERARALAPDFPTAHRNLALAYFDHRGDAAAALASMQSAFAADPSDPRLFFELLMACKSCGVGVEERLALLSAHWDLAEERNDCHVEAVRLLVQAGRLDEADRRIRSHVYDVYEGGEGKLIRTFEWLSLLRGLRRLAAGDASGAAATMLASLDLPAAFHEGRSAVNPVNHVHFLAGCTAAADGRADEAAASFREATARVVRTGEATYYRGLALRRLGRDEEAEAAFAELRAEGDALVAKGGRYDYFATGTPTPLPFEGNRERHNLSEGHYLLALAEAGRGRTDESRAALACALAADPNHLGAWIHADRAGAEVSTCGRT